MIQVLLNGELDAGRESLCGEATSTITTAMTDETSDDIVIHSANEDRAAPVHDANAEENKDKNALSQRRLSTREAVETLAHAINEYVMACL